MSAYLFVAYSIVATRFYQRIRPRSESTLSTLVLVAIWPLLLILVVASLVAELLVLAIDEK